MYLPSMLEMSETVMGAAAPSYLLLPPAPSPSRTANHPSLLLLLHKALEPPHPRHKGAYCFSCLVAGLAYVLLGTGPASLATACPPGHPTPGMANGETFSTLGEQNPVGFGGRAPPRGQKVSVDQHLASRLLA